MKPISLDQFLDLPWSDNVRHVLRTKSDRDDLLALAATQVDGRLTAQAWTRWPDAWPPNLVAIWCKQPLPGTGAGKSRTLQAVDLVLDQGLTVYAAAKQLGISQSAVHRAMARREGKHCCPVCKQLVRAGFFVDRSVLKNPAL